LTNGSATLIVDDNGPATLRVIGKTTLITVEKMTQQH
jgi:hypothetical protein